MRPERIRHIREQHISVR